MAEICSSEVGEVIHLHHASGVSLLLHHLVARISATMNDKVLCNIRD
ncbi:unnamed protein product [Brassica oleracea var. botrytis]